MRLWAPRMMEQHCMTIENLTNSLSTWGYMLFLFQNVDFEVRAGLSSVYNDPSKGWVADNVHSEGASRTLAYGLFSLCNSLYPRRRLCGIRPCRHLKTTRQYHCILVWKSDADPFTLFNKQTGFMEARNKDGSWAGDTRGWTEGDHLQPVHLCSSNIIPTGDKWAYSFDVVHTIPELHSNEVCGILLLDLDHILTLLWCSRHTIFHIFTHCQERPLRRRNESMKLLWPTIITLRMGCPVLLYDWVFSSISSRFLSVTDKHGWKQNEDWPDECMVYFQRDGLLSCESRLWGVRGQIVSCELFMSSSRDHLFTNPFVFSPFFEKISIDLDVPSADGWRKRRLTITAPCARTKPYIKSLTI